jgi:hypothetical protein
MLVTVKDDRTSLGKVTDMKYLFATVAVAALIGLAPLAIAQTSSDTTTGAKQRRGAGDTTTGAQPSMGGTTSTAPGSGTSTGAKQRRGASGDDTTTGAQPSTGGATAPGSGTSTGAKQRRGAGSGSDSDMTRQLNEQELKRQH